MKYSITEIKNLGLNKSEKNFDLLLSLYNDKSLGVDIRREIVSSIGRQNNEERIYNFIINNVYNCGFMDMVYQMYRTCLYKKNDKFDKLALDIEKHFNNEMIYKMKRYKNCKNTDICVKKSKIKKPLLLCGDNVNTLKRLSKKSINLIFTSPPYYNAREYSDYKSYQNYLSKMYDTLKECYEVLEDGRFILINVSPVITKRPGREFESVRYPIHFDFHNILTKAGFYFVDEIIWIKPESCCPNRNGGYQQTKMPLSYKPNCITESILVYRKNADFLLDKNIKNYDKSYANDGEIDSSNCWYINPKSNKNHPAVFPEELCRKVLKYYSFKGDVVLDPFAGSGTFGKVAIKMDRIPVLCENNEQYIKYLKELNYDIISENDN